MFESVDRQRNRQTDRQTTARLVYYKLTNEPSAQVSLKCGGERDWQYLNPKHSQCILKKNTHTGKNSKKYFLLTEPGLEPTTSGLEKPALLSTRLNTIIAITT